MNPPPLVRPSRTGPGRRLFRAGIAWRFASTVFFGYLLVLVLYMFKQKDKLGVWEKRWFNTLTILLSAIVSLLLGSLLGLLGSMLRWSLLAWEEHTPREVGTDTLSASCSALIQGSNQKSGRVNY